MRRFLLATLYLLPIMAVAQSRMKLTGTVSDSSKPLALVTVRLFQANKPDPLQTAISKDNGNFELVKPASGNYSLSFTHTGFAEKRMTITVAAGAGNMQIDPVRLSRQSQTLGEVVVKSQRPLIEQADDKIVFNVEY